MSQALANLIRQRLDELASSYQEQLLAIGGGYKRATPARLSEIAHHDLERIAQSLETGDPAPWLDWIQDYLSKHPGTSFELETFLQAMSALEDVLLTQADNLDDSRSLWRITRQARTAITELTSQRWRESESKFRQLFDRSPVGIFRTTPGGQIVEVNPAFLNILGYDSLEAMSKVNAPSLYKDPADRERLLELLQQGPVTGFETYFRRADGQLAPISITARSVEVGQEHFIEGVITDITQRKQAEQALQQLARAVEATHDAVFITDCAGAIQFVNPAFERITGYSQSQALGKNPSILKSGQQPDEFYAEMWRTITSGQVWQGDVTNRRQDGALYEAQLTISPMRDESGEIEQFVALQRDVTAQRRLQAQLVESERKYRHIVDRSLVGIYRTTPGGRILEVNPTILNMLGLESLEHANRVGLENIYLDVGDQRTLLKMLNRGPVMGLEVRFRHTSGRIVHVSLSANLVRDEQGQPQYVEGTVEDITARKRAEQELEEQHAFLRQVIDIIPHLIFAKDREGRFTLVNEALTQVYGTTVQDLTGKTDADFNPNLEEVEQFRLDDVAVMDSLQEKVISEEVITDATGETRWLRTIKRPLIDADGVARQMLGVATDITQRKLLELEREKTQERRARQVQLSTAIAHEIAAAPSLNELFRRAVTLIKERMDYYHVQILRYEPALGAVLLVNGYGKIGEKMVSDGYRVELEQGAVGEVAASGQPVLINDVSQVPGWEPNLYLPDTQGELALPIVTRREQAGEQHEEMLGILDVHSETAGALSIETQLTLEDLCGRLAIAIETLRLRQEMEGRLQELDALYRATTREGWQAVTPEAWSYRFTPLTSTLESLEESEPPSALDFPEDVVSVPLLLRGETIGNVDIYDDPQAAISPDDIALVQAAAEQATQALERARLFEQTQVTLTQTELLYNTGRRLNAAEDLQEIVASVVEGVPVPAVNRAVLFLYERDSAGAMESALVAANWYSGQGTPPMPPGQRYPWQMFSVSLSLLLGSEPIFIDDVWHDERVGPDMREVVKQQNVRALAALPLWVGVRQLGTMLLQADETHHFSEREMQPYRALAGQMAVAIDNRNLFQQTQEALAERQALYQASARLNTALSYDDILSTLREHTILGPGAVNISLQFFDRPWTGERTPEWLDVLAYWTRLPEAPLSSRYPLSVFPSASRILRPDAPSAIEDIGADQRLDDKTRNRLLDTLGAKSTLFVPLVVAGQWLGLLNSFYDAPTHFPQAALRRVMTLSGQAAVAAQSLRQLEEIQARAESEQHLRQVVATINASKDVTTDLYAIAQQLSDLAPLDTLSLATYPPDSPDYDRFDIDLRAAPGVPRGIRHLLRGTAPGWVITNRQTRLEADIRSAQRGERPFIEDQELIAQGIVSRLLLPLQVGERIIGVLNLNSAQPAAYTQEHITALNPVADQIALALERAELLSETQAALAEVDATHRRFLGGEWDAVLAALPDRVWGYWDGPEGMIPTEDVWTTEIEQAVAANALVTMIEPSTDPDQPPARSALAVPIHLRGQTIGVLDFYHEDETRAWTEDDKALVTALAAQVGLALEGQRLFEQIQRRSSRERLTTEVVDKIRAAGDIQSILETATQELSHALGVSRTLIRLGSPEAHSSGDQAPSSEDRDANDIARGET